MWQCGLELSAYDAVAGSREELYFSSIPPLLHAADTLLICWAHLTTEKEFYLSKHVKLNTVCLQMNGAVSKVNKKFISHLTRAKCTPSAAATVQVSHVLPAVRFSCLLLGCGASFQDGVTAGKGFLCAPF